MAGEASDAYVPTDEELAYDYLTAQLYVDYAAAIGEVADLVADWYSAAAEYFSPLRGAVRKTRGVQRVSAIEWYDGHPGRQYWPREFLAGLTDRLYRLSVEWSTGTEVLWSSDDHGLAYVNAAVAVHRFPADPAHLGLVLTARVARHVTNPDPLAVEVADLVGRLAESARPTYGDVSMTAPQQPPATRLDVALARKPTESAQHSRMSLRGFEWVTICPAQLVASLGGADRLRATHAFTDVRELADGAALLQATPGPRGYDDGAAARVFTALSPVLPARTQDVYR